MRRVVVLLSFSMVVLAISDSKAQFGKGPRLSRSYKKFKRQFKWMQHSVNGPSASLGRVALEIESMRAPRQVRNAALDGMRQALKDKDTRVTQVNAPSPRTSHLIKKAKLQPMNTPFNASFRSLEKTEPAEGNFWVGYRGIRRYYPGIQLDIRANPRAGQGEPVLEILYPKAGLRTYRNTTASGETFTVEELQNGSWIKHANTYGVD
ncbi:MAG: hypothetical protein ACK2U9_09970 [Anaerolineae bacterium]|jgi:hypothetical protein